MAALLRKKSMTIVRKNSHLLYTLDFGKLTYESEILDRSSPLNALYQRHNHVLPTQYRNIAISMSAGEYYINVYSKSQKKWQEIKIESLDEA